MHNFLDNVRDLSNFLYYSLNRDNLFNKNLNLFKPIIVIRDLVLDNLYLVLNK